MDLSKLSLQDKIILGAAVLLTIAMFLPWFTFEAFGYSTSFSGFDVGFLFSWIPWLLSLVMAGQVAVSNFKPEQDIPDLPIPWSQAHLYAGGAAGALLVLKLLIGDSGLDRGFGLILAVIAGGGLAYGGFLKSKEEDGGSAGAPPAPPTEF